MINFVFFSGPSVWYKNFPKAGGNRQSPVNIDSKTCKSHTFSHPLKANYSSEANMEVTNNGFTFVATIKGENSKWFSLIAINKRKKWNQIKFKFYDHSCPFNLFYKEHWPQGNEFKNCGLDANQKLVNLFFFFFCYFLKLRQNSASFSKRYMLRFLKISVSN